MYIFVRKYIVSTKTPEDTDKGVSSGSNEKMRRKRNIVIFFYYYILPF